MTEITDWGVMWERRFDFCEELDSPLLGIILDHKWIISVKDEFLQWMQENNCVITDGGLASGGLFLLPNEETKVLFILRWS